jgi:hypothetical protein
MKHENKNKNNFKNKKEFNFEFFMQKLLLYHREI